MSKQKTTPQPVYSLNEQIQQLQQQIAAERKLQQHNQLQFRQILTERLTSWPVLLGGIAAGVLLRRAYITENAQVQRPPELATAPTSEMSADASAPIAAEPQSYWSTLLSLPLLTQSIWWLLQQLWQSQLFRDVVRHKLIKLNHRHPPY
ncbi:hypothetical protein A5320_10305 [Rheinheimera sp. SA_1]|jgi:hypothetical protein|uniref:hypothetical protein n=1 Tax=Rheinheimera sp. SA_1 TaxID=1827365 RepID=UPI000800D9D5|nr:hypothetical protein [Rheinheimera sp. SA_1]OBP15691.1 hypothetical protein A5320_10305 [Rheinheimera sp. SA_1]